METNKNITSDFIKSVCTEAKNANGGWLEMSNLPSIGIGYSVTPFEDKTVIRFDSPVTTPDGQTGTRFKVLPVSKRKPAGQFSGLR
jgi:hypothetical protein